MGFHLPITDDYSDGGGSLGWMNAVVTVRITPLHPFGQPRKYTADAGCNLRHLGQWGDTMLPFSREEPVMIGMHSTKFLVCLGRVLTFNQEYLMFVLSILTSGYP
jgi:hypothetical protein